MKVLFLILLLISQPAFSQENCSSKIRTPRHLTPEVLAHFSQVSKISDPGELLCCLAREHEMEVGVSLRSFAAQDGHYDRPRVIVKIGDFILSINSGHSSLNQKDSVEMMYDNPQTRELEYSDLSYLNGKSHLSRTNFQDCMGCHGEKGKVPTRGGPKPILTQAPWPDFAQLIPAAAVAPGRTFCPNGRKLHQKLTEESHKVLATHDRFKCLSGKHVKEIDLGGLDRELFGLNARRVAKIIRSTPNYQFYKYAIIGADLCEDFTPEEWIPPQILQTMNNESFLSLKLKENPSWISKLDLQKHLYDELLKEAEGDLALNREHGVQLEKLEQGQRINFTPPDDLRLNCRTPLNIRNFEGFEDGKQKGSSRFELMGESSTYNRYRADTLARDGEGPALRFLFESRGMDTSNWSMQRTPGYDRTPKPSGYLVQEELENSPLKKIFSEGFTEQNTFPGNQQTDFCPKLKKRSQQKLTNLAQQLHPQQPTPTTTK